MSTHTVVTCDRRREGGTCGQHAAVDDDNLTYVRKQVRHRGWAHVNGRDYCPGCADEFGIGPRR